MTRRSLVVGVGNPDRGDDAAGLIAVRSLGGARIAEIADCVKLLDLWDDEESVIIVDAMTSGGPPGLVRRFDAVSERLPIATFPSTHVFGLAEVIELARALNRLPAGLTVFGIEAASFDHGAPMTPQVEEAALDVARQIEEDGV